MCMGTSIFFFFFSHIINDIWFRPYYFSKRIIRPHAFSFAIEHLSQKGQLTGIKKLILFEFSLNLTKISEKRIQKNTGPWTTVALTLYFKN